MYTYDIGRHHNLCPIQSLKSEMGNSSLGSATNPICFDSNLSRNSVTPEFWDIHAISPPFANNAISIAVIMLLFLIIGLPSNIIIIASIIKQKLYRETTHILLLNLAISDVLVCLLVLPLSMVTGFAGGYIFGDSDFIRCQVCQTGVIFVALTVFAVNILAVITLDRFIVFKFPLHHTRYITKPRVIIIVAVLWVVSIFESVLPLFGFGSISFSFSLSSCTVNLFGEGRLTNNINYGLLLLLLNLIPIVIIIVFNIWIACIVSKQIKIVYRTRRSFGNKEELRKYNQGLRKQIHRKKNRKQIVLVRAFGGILLSTILVWVPMAFHVVIINFVTVPVGFLSFAFLSFIMHSVLHPLIEGCFIPEIKTSFKRVLGITFLTDLVKRRRKKRKESAAVVFNLNQLELYNEEKGCFSKCYELFNAGAIPESQVPGPESPTRIELNV